MEINNYVATEIEQILLLMTYVSNIYNHINE